MVRMLTTIAALLATIALVQGQAPAEQSPADRPAAQQPAAQQQPAQQQPAQRNEPYDAGQAKPSDAAQAKPAQAAEKMTLSGCLRPGPTAGTWLLENAEVAAPASAAQTPGAAAPAGGAVRGTTGTPSAKKTYSLVVKPGEDLKAHANHRIEITGMASPATAARPANSAPSEKSAADSTPPQNFNVDSFKMVSPNCQ